ncbi:MAG: type II toxin-antitoxin system RelE/ParE family toxin [Pseudomonadota bacterium]
MKPFAFHREADAEFIDALRYYADISTELGGRYYDEIYRLIAEACKAPATFRFIRKPARRHFTGDFPYGIIYVERPDDLWILAVMHLHREPGYWTHLLG